MSASLKHRVFFSRHFDVVLLLNIIHGSFFCYVLSVIVMCSNRLVGGGDACVS